MIVCLTQELEAMYEKVKERLSRAKETNLLLQRSLTGQTMMMMRHRPNGINNAVFSATKTDSNYCRTGTITNWVENLDVGIDDTASLTSEFDPASGVFTYQNQDGNQAVWYFQGSFRQATYPNTTVDSA